jgi:hypothetical protein
MQVLAKAALIVLGVYAILTLCNAYPSRYMYRHEQPAVVLEMLSLCTFAVLAALTVYFMIFKNTALSKRIAGPGEILDPGSQALWLVKSLRVGLVLAGLMLLPGSVPMIVKIPRIFFLIRPALNDIIISKRVPNILRLSYSEWFKNIHGFLRAILAIYLIYGAPHFTRWQAKQDLHSQGTIERTEIPNSSITNQERPENE